MTNTSNSSKIDCAHQRVLILELRFAKIAQIANLMTVFVGEAKMPHSISDRQCRKCRILEVGVWGIYANGAQPWTNRLLGNSLQGTEIRDTVAALLVMHTTAFHFDSHLAYLALTRQIWQVWQRSAKHNSVRAWRSTIDNMHKMCTKRTAIRSTWLRNKINRWVWEKSRGTWGGSWRFCWQQSISMFRHHVDSNNRTIAHVSWYILSTPKYNHGESLWLAGFTKHSWSAGMGSNMTSW